MYWHSIQLKIIDVQAFYDHQVEASHAGRPEVVLQEYMGHHGHPHTIINTVADFLPWAYGHCTTSGISDFLGVSRATIRHGLLSGSVYLKMKLHFPELIHFLKMTGLPLMPHYIDSHWHPAGLPTDTLLDSHWHYICYPAQHCSALLETHTRSTSNAH